MELGQSGPVPVYGNRREIPITMDFVTPGKNRKNWKSFQIEILKNSRKIGEYYELRISDVSREDEGIYECKISNEQKFKKIGHQKTYGTRKLPK